MVSDGGLWVGPMGGLYEEGGEVGEESGGSKE
jgi:hypothetical protein